MTARELLAPRFELIADFPNRADMNIHVGDIVTLDYWSEKDQKYGLKKGTLTTYAPYYEQYPHLFRRLNWWEGRTAEQMPMYLISQAYSNAEPIEVVKWDMGEMFGYTNLDKKQGCSLGTFKPEFEYLPIDKPAAEQVA